MSDRLFRRDVSTSALCVDVPDDAADRLHDAEQRIAQLEAMLQASVIELADYRALVAAKNAAIKSAKPKTEPKPKPVKPAKLSALEFWRLHGQAVDKIRAEYGDGWKIKAPIGRTELATVKYTTAKTERGVKLNWSGDQRIPAAEYWPGAVIPEDVAINVDYAREDPERARAWRGIGAVTPIEHDRAWHEAHGYALHNGTWIAEILLRSQLAHEDGIIADREARRIQKLEAACLFYGPQPAVSSEPFDDIADELEKLAAD